MESHCNSSGRKLDPGGMRRHREGKERIKRKVSVTNFIWPYLHQFFDDSHDLNGT